MKDVLVTATACETEGARSLARIHSGDDACNQVPSPCEVWMRQRLERVTDSCTAQSGVAGAWDK